MTEVWGREYVDLGLRCMVDNYRSRSTVRWCWSMVSRCWCGCMVRGRRVVGWSWGVVRRCGCRCMVRGGRFVRGGAVAVAWLLLGLLLPGGPGEADEVEEASEGRGDCMNHVAKEGSCLRQKLGSTGTLTSTWRQ